MYLKSSLDNEVDNLNVSGLFSDPKTFWCLWNGGLLSPGPIAKSAYESQRHHFARDIFSQFKFLFNACISKLYNDYETYVNESCCQYFWFIDLTILYHIAMHISPCIEALMKMRYIAWFSFVLVYDVDSDCLWDSFACDDGTCLHRDLQCDGTQHCNTDEFQPNNSKEYLWWVK